MDIISYPYQSWKGIIISISYLYPYLLDIQKYLNYIYSVGKTCLFVYLKWQDTSLLLMKVVNNWIEESRGSQLWWESIANQKLMPKSCETLKYWDQNFKKSLRGNENDNWFCGLWKIWYDIIDMTILLNISMSHIKISTKILYHITYLNLRYNIRYLYQRYYIFNITEPVLTMQKLTRNQRSNVYLMTWHSSLFRHPPWLLRWRRSLGNCRCCGVLLVCRLLLWHELVG